LKRRGKGGRKGREREGRRERRRRGKIGMYRRLLAYFFLAGVVL